MDNAEDLAQVRSLLYRARRGLRADWRVEAGAQIITAENGKPLADARGEISYGGACCFIAAL